MARKQLSFGENILQNGEHGQIDIDDSEQMILMTERYNFDFRTGRPLIGRYEWELVPNGVTAEETMTANTHGEGDVDDDRITQENDPQHNKE